MVTSSELESKGYTKVTNPDGTITYNSPSETFNASVDRARDEIKKDKYSRESYTFKNGSLLKKEVRAIQTTASTNRFERQDDFVRERLTYKDNSLSRIERFKAEQVSKGGREEVTKIEDTNVLTGVSRTKETATFEVAQARKKKAAETQTTRTTPKVLSTTVRRDPRTGKKTIVKSLAEPTFGEVRQEFIKRGKPAVSTGVSTGFRLAEAPTPKPTKKTTSQIKNSNSIPVSPALYKEFGPTLTRGDTTRFQDSKYRVRLPYRAEEGKPVFLTKATPDTGMLPTKRAGLLFQSLTEFGPKKERPLTTKEKISKAYLTAESFVSTKAIKPTQQFFKTAGPLIPSRAVQKGEGGLLSAKAEKQPKGFLQKADARLIGFFKGMNVQLTERPIATTATFAAGGVLGKAAGTFKFSPVGLGLARNLPVTTSIIKTAAGVGFAGAFIGGTAIGLSRAEGAEAQGQFLGETFVSVAAFGKGLSYGKSVSTEGRFLSAIKRAEAQPPKFTGTQKFRKTTVEKTVYGAKKTDTPALTEYKEIGFPLSAEKVTYVTPGVAVGKGKGVSFVSTPKGTQFLSQDLGGGFYSRSITRKGVTKTKFFITEKKGSRFLFEKTTKAAAPVEVTTGLKVTAKELEITPQPLNRLYVGKTKTGIGASVGVPAKQGGLRPRINVVSEYKTSLKIKTLEQFPSKKTVINSQGTFIEVKDTEFIPVDYTPKPKQMSLTIPEAGTVIAKEPARFVNVQTASAKAKFTIDFVKDTRTPATFKDERLPVSKSLAEFSKGLTDKPLKKPKLATREFIEKAEQTAVTKTVNIQEVKLQERGIKFKFSFTPVTTTAGVGTRVAPPVFITPSKIKPTTKTLPTTRTSSIIKTTPITSTTPITRIDSKIKSRTNITPIADVSQISNIKTSQRSNIDIAQVQRQNIRQEQQQRQQQSLVQVPVKAQVVNLKTYTLTGTGYTPYTITPPPAVPPSIPFLKTGAERKVFGVEVRRRGVFEKLGKGLSLRQAERKGIKEVRTTAAATFRITGPLENVNLKPRSQFRRSKEGKATFIQKRRYRISSSGELRDITFKGLAAQKKKKRREDFLIAF